MLAKVKCSNCGAEMSNLNFSWGKKQWLFIVPIMLIGFLPLARMMFFQGDATKDLSVSKVQKRDAGGSLEIVGLITNTGSRKWSGVTVEAEFFDAAGNFIDEAQEFLRSDVQAGAKEHFKIRVTQPVPAMTATETKMVVKVSGGHTSPF